MGPELLGAFTPLIRILLATALLSASALQGSGQATPVEITFLDVGQGDAVVVRAPGGEVLMVDAGSDAPLRALSRLGVDSIDLLVATHPHADHIGGMQGVLTARPVARYLSGGDTSSSSLSQGVEATLDRISGATRLSAEGQRLQVGDLSVEVLPFASRDPGMEGKAPAPSVGLVVRYGGFSALLSGDAEEVQLAAWVEAEVVPEVTLLKASHHGSQSGFTVPFVEAAHPELVVISVGGANRRGHPRPEALTAYGSVASTVLRTDVHGHVTVRGFPDGSYEMLTGADLDDLQRMDPERGETDASTPGSSSQAGADEALAMGADEALAMEVEVDAPGFRPGDLNRDHAIIANRGDTAVDLSGWRLCDISTRCFRFPSGTSAPPGRRIVVYTGYGIPDGASYFMNNDRRVWNEDGDEASLYDADGRLVLRHVY